MRPLLILIDLDRTDAADSEPHPAAVRQRAETLRRFCRDRDVPVVRLCTTDPVGPSPVPAVGDEPVVSAGAAGPGPALLDSIRRTQADTLVLAGFHLHDTVRLTAQQLVASGRTVVTAEDACGSNEPLHAATTRRLLESRGVRFVSTDWLIRSQLRAVPSAAAPSWAVQAAVERAAAFDRRRCGEPAPPFDAVLRLAELLATQADDLAARMAREFGKPVRFGRVEAQRTAEKLRAVVRRIRGEGDRPAGGSVRLRRRPHGVVAVITPYNNPIYLAVGKIAAAVLYGNTAVWKPSPRAAAVSQRLMELIVQAGLPEGMVVPVEGGRHEAEELMDHPAVAAVTLTGSSSAGYSAQAVCARRRIPLQAELGGNNPVLVAADADLPEAARRIAAGAFEFAGQRCTAGRRAVVEQAVREPFLRLLAEATAALHRGDPLDPATRIGPPACPAHRDRIAAVVARAVESCGPPLPTPGSNEPVGVGHADYPPTILCCDDPSLEIVQEEAFGPVLVVQTARDFDHALELCNGVRQGLAAAVFTRSHAAVERFLREARAGILKINRSTADADVDVPFGGWKASGVGPPEHGVFDREFFTRPQTVYGEPPQGERR